MSDTLIKVENVSKKFCRSLKKSLWYGVKDMGSEFFGSSNSHNELRDGEFWANKDISFEVKRGETIGLIGHNGAGKTTLLRMLNGLIKPDKGRIEIRGRMQALIALGAGFNPILSGRENVYVNAAVLGISKAEIDRKFDEIVAFSGIEEFIDAPVQSYSSGMAVRLGFAVAAHMEPDILLVDEVLAVGDLAFAIKCNVKMSELRNQGISIVVVSHNMQAIRNMSNKAVWLEKGMIQEIGVTNVVCDGYEINNYKNNNIKATGSKLSYNDKVEILNVLFLNEYCKTTEIYNVGSKLIIDIEFIAKHKIIKPVFTISIFNSELILVCSNYSTFDNLIIDDLEGRKIIRYTIDSINFKPGVYFCSITISEIEVSNTLVWHEKVYNFKVAGNSTNYGMFNPHPKWDILF